MESVAYCPSNVRFYKASEEQPFMDHICPFYKQFCQTHENDSAYITEMASYRVVKPNKTNVELSLAKCDVPEKYPTDGLQAAVEDIVFRMYEKELTQGALESGDTFYLNLATSPGSKYKKQGFKTKETAVMYSSVYDDMHDTSKVPLHDYNHKIELLPLTKILKKKIRGTFNPHLDFLLQQKILFDKQNDMIIEAHPEKWIQCGFAKEYAGFSRLGKRLEPFSHVFTDDGIGWDRSISLRGVYNLRRRGFTQYDDYKVLYEYVSLFTKYSYVLCPDGVVRVRVTGNCSGSNNTTVDNSLAHCLLFTRLVFKAFLFGLGRFPTYFELLQQTLPFIYSDDIIYGINLEYINMSVSDWNNLKTETYLEFGITLDDDAKVIHYGPGILSSELAFLGSNFIYDEALACYIPYPDISKLASSLYFPEETYPGLENTIDKVFSLTLLSAPNPRFFKESLSFLKFLLSISDVEKSDLLYNLVRMGSPRLWLHYALGKEGGGGFKMSNDAVLAERAISSICRQLDITRKGKLWLDRALDPFKDIGDDVAGYPDSVLTPSVIETVHDELAVSAPGAVNWDCNIFLDQLYSQVDLQVTTSSAAYSFNSTAQGAQNYKRGGVVVRSDTAGNTLGMSTSKSGLSLKSDVFTDADARVVGIGLEVHNTTAPINKQGAVTLWQVPDLPDSIPTVLIEDSATACLPNTYSGCYLIEPPTTASAAIDLPGSVEWEAKEGGYVVSRMVDPENQPKGLQYMVPVVQDGTNSYLPTIKNIGAAKLKYTDHLNQAMPWSMTGMYFTGLSPETSLKVLVTYYVEIFPKKSNVLRRLAKPSPAPDANALKLYGEIIAKLPVGCPVRENGFGGFISSIASIAKTVAPLVKPTLNALAVGSNTFSAIRKDARIRKEKEESKVRDFHGNVPTPNVDNTMTVIGEKNHNNVGNRWLQPGEVPRKSKPKMPSGQVAGKNAPKNRKAPKGG
jgi:hypothetical protein